MTGQPLSSRLTDRLYPWLRLASLLLVALVLTGALGCKGAYTRKMDAAMGAFVVHDFDTAAMYTQERVENSPERDQMLVLLEHGTVLHAANRWEESVTVLQQADDMWEYHQEQADLDITDESFATITKLSMLPYRGRAYDAIMMNTLMALNYMAIGDMEAARIQIDRAYFRQRDAVQRNAKRIEKAQEKAVEAAKEDQYDASRAQQDEKFAAQTAEVYAELEADVSRFKAYANYVNPFTQLVRGIFLMTAGYDAADLETARVSFENLKGMVSDPRYVEEDLALATEVSRGTPMTPTTWVILETGRAPERQSVRIDIPVFLAGRHSGGVDYVGASFPILSKQDAGSCVRYLDVTAGEQSRRTTLLCSMDAVISQDFKNELPLIITRTLVSAGIKATSAYFINKGTEGNVWANAIARVGTTVYQAAMNEADVRSWMTLPKEMHYARFATPADGRVTLTSPDGQQHQVPVDPTAPVNLIKVRTVQSGAPLAITHYQLSADSAMARAHGPITIASTHATSGEVQR